MKKSIFIFISILIVCASGKGTKKKKPVKIVKPVDSTLVVDVHEFKPTVIDGGVYKKHGEPETRDFKGHDIDLWNRLSKDLNLKFRYNFVDSFSNVMPRLKQEEAHVSLGGITITANREKDADFVPYMRSGAGILITKDVGFWINFWLNVKFYVLQLPLKLYPFFIGWACYICFCALVMFFLEKGNPDFNDKFSKGFPEARFFVHVVISSTGFGNQIPLSKWGRRVTVLLMYSGIAYMFPMITGKITSEISAKELSYITCKEDLRGKRVALKNGTVTAQSKTLHDIGIEPIFVKDVNNGILLLKDGTVDAVVHDKPALEYAAKDDENLSVVDELFDVQMYGIALQNNSPLREKINQKILEYEESGVLDKLSVKWLGSLGD